MVISDSEFRFRAIMDAEFRFVKALDGLRQLTL
jgi:hypothetical protein